MNPILPKGVGPALRAVDRTPASVAGPPPPPNPRLRLEPALGVVVIEFRNGSEQIQRSVPSEPELQAYRLAQRIGRKLD